MIAGIIMFISLFWLPFLMAWENINQTKFKKNIVAGVTLPFEAREDEEVKGRLHRFVKHEKLICALLLLCAVPTVFFKDSFAALEYLMCWVFFVCILPEIPYVFCNRDLKKIKRERNWGFENPDSIIVDTSNIAPAKWLSPWSFILPFAAAFVPFLWDRSFLAMYLANSLCIILCGLSYRYLYRNKSERIDDDQSLTKALTEIRRKSWGRVWLLTAWTMAVLNMCVAAFGSEPVPVTVAVLVLSMVMVAAIVGIEVKTKKMQEKLCAVSGKGVYVDDDDKWIWGLLYYNPDDSHLIINDRVGINSSINLARPAGKLIAIILAAVMLSIPFIIPVTHSLVNKAPVIEVTEMALTAKSGGTNYEIPLDDIKTAELMEELPPKLVRTMGTGFQNLLKGDFSAQDYGSMKVCLDPQCPPYLFVEKENGEKYLVGSREEGKIQEIYEMIK